MYGGYGAGYGGMGSGVPYGVGWPAAPASHSYGSHAPGATGVSYHPGMMPPSVAMRAPATGDTGYTTSSMAYAGQPSGMSASLGPAPYDASATYQAAVANAYMAGMMAASAGSAINPTMPGSGGGGGSGSSSSSSSISVQHAPALYGTAAHAPSFGGSSSMGHWMPSGSPMPFASHASSHAYTSAMAAPPRGMGGMGTTSSFVPRGPVPPALAPRAAYPSTSFAAPHHAAAARPARAALAPRGVVPRCDAASTAGPADKNVSGQARSAGVSATSRLAAEQPPPPAPMAARASALLPLQPRAGTPPTPMRSTAMYMPPPQPGFPKTAAEGTYACVACDRGFDSRRDLSLHQSTHTQCPVPGCPFSASQKALQAHLSRDHRPARRDGSSAAARGGTTGDEEDEESAAYNAGVRMPPSLLEIIPPKYRGAWQVGDSDADIQRWRQERRKNFPSAAKVQEKEAASVIAVARGVLGAEPAPVSGSSDASAAPSLAAATPPTNVNDGVEAGTVDAQPPAHDDCANEGSDTRLGIMLGEDGVDAGEALAAVGPTADANDRFAAPMRGVCRMFLQGRCRRGRYCRFSHDTGQRSRGSVAAGATAGADPAASLEAEKILAAAANDSVASHGPAAKRRRLAATDGSSVSAAPACKYYLLGVCRRGASCPNSHGAATGLSATIRSPLLRRLLSNEVQREASCVLQCIRYIVSNNFFKPAASLVPIDDASTAADTALVEAGELHAAGVSLIEEVEYRGPDKNTCDAPDEECTTSEKNGVPPLGTSLACEE